jgi:hypothetical protein
MALWSLKNLDLPYKVLLIIILICKETQAHGVTM